MTRCVRCTTAMLALSVFCPQCQHPNEPDFKQLLHQKLGDRFQIYRQLSEGGLSTVYAAIDLRTDQTVVVKVSDPRHLTQSSFQSAAELAEARQYWAEMTDRMQREVAALTDIHHPHIVRVLAAGTVSSDLSYVVMELLRGKTLRDELNQKQQLTLAESLAIAQQVAAGLCVVHARDIVHRDLTPRNIFLCAENNPADLLQNPAVKLIDFGIAKFPKPAGAQTYTQHAVMAGTPGYAAPEQFQNLAVDQRTDLYAFGVILYEMLTGTKPFPGKTATEIALKQLTQEPIRPRTFVPELPIRLEALILRALAKEPTMRQTSIEEIAQELKTINMRVEIPLTEPIRPLSLSQTPEPSASEVYAVLAQRAEPATPADNQTDSIGATAAKDVSAPVNIAVIESQRGTGKWLAAAAVAVLIIGASWIFARETPSLTKLQAALPNFELADLSRIAMPTPTIRPDVTAPKTSSRVEQTNLPEKIAEVSRTDPKDEMRTLSPISEKKAGAVALPSGQAAKTTQSTGTTVIPAPNIKPIVQITPQPAPVPTPVQVTRTIPEQNPDKWSPQTLPPTVKPPESRQRPPRTVVPAEPRLLTWQGRVNGAREIVLETPGVPGIIDIPRNLRKKVGVVEPPSPSNGWRRIVLRVFGNGDVSLIVRWMPQAFAHSTTQEIVWQSSFR